MHPNAQLYEDDFALWAETTAEAIRKARWQDIDLNTVAEEIAGLARSDRRARRSHLQGLLLHLLKWRYQPQGCATGQSWRASIRNHRREIEDLLSESPSLRPTVQALLAQCYRYGLQDAADETGLPLATFPETCPWTLAQVLAHDFWPEP
jgi:hypothetical protein